jgi:hypothetical protein
MPKTTRLKREQGRLRLLKFRQQRQASNLVEVRTYLPRDTAVELELAAYFIPDGTKDSLVRNAVELYLERTGTESRKIVELIRKYWETILDYKAYAPTLSHSSQRPVVIKGRTYTAETAVKMLEIAGRITSFLKSRGIQHPEDTAFALYQRLKSRN